MQGMLLALFLFWGFYLIAAVADYCNAVGFCMIMLIWECAEGNGGGTDEAGSQGQAQ
jgi:hypothetical protein